MLRPSDRYAKHDAPAIGRVPPGELIAAPPVAERPAFVCSLAAIHALGQTGPTPWASTNRWSRQHGESEVGRPWVSIDLVFVSSIPAGLRSWNRRTPSPSRIGITWI